MHGNRRKWLGENFGDFINNIPREQLLNQLYMFSNDFNINEAVDNVQRLSLYFFSDLFDKGIDDINIKTALNLVPIHIRKTSYKSHISEHELDKLRKMLEKEYWFLNNIRDLQIAKQSTHQDSVKRADSSSYA